MNESLRMRDLERTKQMAEGFDKAERMVVLSVMPIDEMLDCLKIRCNNMVSIHKQLEFIITGKKEGARNE